MATQWEHRIHVVVNAAAASAVISALNVAFPRDNGVPMDPASPQLLAMPLVGSGGPWYGASFVVTEAIRESLEGMGLASAPGVIYWRCSNPGDILAVSNHAGSLSSVGQSWSWQSCLDAVGLRQ